MTFPAARVGDSTMHGPPLTGVGCPTVLIGGMPAWRMGDTHTCSMVNAPPPAGPGTPHGPGVATMASMTVMIGQQPCVRAMDMINEPGAIVPLPPINPILSGCFTVLVGGPTALMTQNADGTWSCTYGNNITVTGSPEFVALALRDLGTLNATPSGRALLQSIENSGHNVTITECGPGNDGAWDGPWGDPALYNGTGADANVEYNPHRSPMYDGSQPWMNPPTAVTLGHELTHASHITNGNLPGNPTTGPGVPNDTVSSLPMNRALEERRTVGAPADPYFNMPDYSNEPFSENAIRRDLGEPERPTYTYDPNPAVPRW